MNTPKTQPPSPLAEAPCSATARNVELAIAELERSRWALERKDWILAQVYANHAVGWIKAAQRSDETEESPNVKLCREAGQKDAR